MLTVLAFAAALLEEVKVAHENKRRAEAKAAELATTVKTTGPRPPIKKESKDAAKDGKDAKKDAKATAKGPATKDNAKGAAKDPAKDEAAVFLAAQKAAALALDERIEEDRKRRNTALYLPKVLQDYNAGVTTIDIIGRLLWFSSDAKLDLEAAGQLYEQAEKAFPEIPYVKVIRACYCTNTSNDPSVHLPKLDVIKKMNPSVLSRYYVHKRQLDIRNRTKVVKSGDENTLDLVAYIEFQNLFA